MKSRFIFLFLLFIFALIQAQNVTLEAIDAEIAAGDFSKAKKSIDLYIAQNNLSAKEFRDSIEFRIITGPPNPKAFRKISLTSMFPV